MPSSSVDVCAIMVAYHGVDSLRKALAALDGVDIVVIDNSADVEVRAAAQEAGAQYVDSGGNLGFAPAVNLGIAHAGGRDIVLVNPDAEVSAQTVRAMVKRMRTPGSRVAAVAPSLTQPDGR
ncbi:MAG: glycosyltransferase, partial [Actinomycetota bacterium]|nr:glycosyltransferase [Actinomycetota bacterium]